MRVTADHQVGRMWFREHALATQRAERRLAAVLAADVAGYSRLMGADEEGTLAQVKAHRRELIDPKISDHRGRIVKTTGDGILIEFPSVIEAVSCAVAVQPRPRSIVALSVPRILRPLLSVFWRGKPSHDTAHPTSITAAREAVVPASPTPLTPSGLVVQRTGCSRLTTATIACYLHLAPRLDTAADSGRRHVSRAELRVVFLPLFCRAG